MWFLRPGMNLESALITIAASLLVIFLVMPFHEIAHSFVAYKLGDDTSKFYGGLSLGRWFAAVLKGLFERDCR